MYLVDSVGGVTVTVTDGFCDPGYKEYGISGFSISPGRYRFDGEQALAYRVRKAAASPTSPGPPGEQEVIGALRDKIVKGAFLETRPVPQVPRPDRADQHQAVVHRGLDRGRLGGRPPGRLPRCHRPLLVRGAYDERG